MKARGADPLRGRVIPLLAGGLLFLSVEGCIIIPTPEHNFGWFDNQPVNARLNLSKQRAEEIVPGQTPIEEVLLRLGEPDAVSADGRKIAYRWVKIAGWMFIGGGAGAGSVGGADLRKDYVLVIEFDEKGTILRRRVHSNFWRKRSPADLLESPESSEVDGPHREGQPVHGGANGGAAEL